MAVPTTASASSNSNTNITNSMNSSSGPSTNAQLKGSSSGAAHHTPSPQDVIQDLVQKGRHLVSQMDMQRVWGLSHLLFVTLSFLYLANSVLFNIHFVSFAYRLSMQCLMIGYGIAVRRHVGHFSADLATIERAFSYDGTPYFCLALMWWVMAAPVPATLLPLAVYSAYHAIAWAKDDGMVRGSGWWREWGEGMCRWMAGHQSSLLFAAAHLEIAALPYMAIAWVVSKRGPGFTQLLFYVQFLRWQHTVSPKIKAAMKQWEAGWESAVQHPSCPKNIRAADRWVRDQLRSTQAPSNSYSGSINRPRPNFTNSGTGGSKKFN